MNNADENSKIKIQIINGTGDENKLEIAEHELSSLGYKISTIESNEVDSTMIINQSDLSSEQMQNIKNTLQKGKIENNKSESSTYDVRIILGKDYEE